MKRLLLTIAVCVSLIAAGCGENGDAATSGPDTGGTGLGPKLKVPQGPSTQKLIVRDLKTGSGEAIKRGDLAVVHYVAGIYETGEEIESAWVAGNPLVLRLTPSGVLPGWVQGMPGMRVGGRRELIFPATKGNSPLESEPGDTLVYVVDLVGIE